MARKSYKKRYSRKARYGGGDSYPAASPSSYSDGQSYMLATVGKGNVQYDNVFLTDKPTVDGNAIVGLQGQHAGRRRRKSKTMKNTKKRKGGYWGQVINQAIVPFGILGLQQSYGRRKHGTKKNRY
jgi:hypothetical protein